MCPPTLSRMRQSRLWLRLALNWNAYFCLIAMLLECLFLFDCDVTDAALWAVAQGCPQLKELDVSLNPVSNAAIQAVAQACPQLKKLNVTNCLNDETLDLVAWVVWGAARPA